MFHLFIYIDNIVLIQKGEIMANIVPVKKENENKMSLDDYINKYSVPKRTKEVKSLLFLIIAGIGIVIGVMLFFFVERLFQMHEVAGYIGLAISVLIFIFVYIVPVVKVTTTKHFITEVDKTNARAAQRYNKQMREEIADKMIDLNVSTKRNDWYTNEKIAPIAIARARKDDKALSVALTDIYNTDVKAAANKLITDSAIQVGVSTSISQSEKIDTLIVTASELNLVKKLVYLYGYRPNDAQMLKIYKSVLTNAILAYGMQSAAASVAGGVAKLIGSAAEAIPIISTVVGSVSSGVINSTLTVAVGFQTIRYLKREYKLQDILSEIVIDESEELEAKMIDDVKKNVVNNSKKRKTA